MSTMDINMIYIDIDRTVTNRWLARKKEIKRMQLVKFYSSGGQRVEIVTGLRIQLFANMLVQRGFIKSTEFSLSQSQFFQKPF